MPLLELDFFSTGDFDNKHFNSKYCYINAAIFPVKSRASFMSQ